MNYICLSGNAPGSDITFQIGSDNNCVIFLPWKSFNEKMFDPSIALDYFIVGDQPEGVESVEQFHPRGKYLNPSVRSLMARNYYQIFGFDKYPKVDFVICCADPTENGKVAGGTGQAVRIALHHKIPVVNIRDTNWKSKYDEIICRIEMLDAFS